MKLLILGVILVAIPTNCQIHYEGTPNIVYYSDIHKDEDKLWLDERQAGSGGNLPDVGIAPVDVLPETAGLVAGVWRTNNIRTNPTNAPQDGTARVTTGACQGRSGTCCIDSNGRVSTRRRIPAASGQCCNGKPYNTASRVCCIKADGSISLRQPPGGVNGQPPSQFSCCEGLPYNRNGNTHVCCGGRRSITPAASNGRQRTRCCGNKPFNLISHLCCNDNLNDPKPRRDSARQQFRCCDGVRAPFNRNAKCYKAGGATCGGQAFDAATQFCCSGSIVAKTRNADRCCGNTSYKRTSSRQNPFKICCNNVVVRGMNGNAKCCGTRSYNINRDKCTDNTGAGTIVRL